MRLIPAIDIIDGKCVRLTQGDYAQQITYNENPLEVAKLFEAAGLQYLHLVDLDGAKASHIVNHKVLELIAQNTSLKIDFGGGIKTDTDIQLAFDCGANQITAGSIAVKSPQTVLRWLAKYGADKIILGADVNGENIAINGWKENSEQNIFEFLETYIQHGITQVICTDIAKDGMLQGSSIELYKRIKERFVNLQLIASGGVKDIADLHALQQAGLHGAIIGKAIYEEQITLLELKNFKPTAC